MEKKRIVITERQSEEITGMIISEAFNDIYVLNPHCVLAVKKYLDKNFRKDEATDIDADGKIVYNRIADWIDKHGNVVSQPSLEKVCKMLDSVNDIRKLVKNDSIRKKFIESVVDAWYDDRIDKNGIIKGVSYIRI